MANKPLKTNDYIILIIGVVLILISIGFYCIQFNGGLSEEQDTFGTFGDYIGGVVGTILSLLSIIYIYRTYIKQIEFSERQQALTTLQSFEASFFNLLQNQHEILMSLRKNGASDYAYMEKVSVELQKRMSDREYGLDEIIPTKIEDERNIIDEIYHEIYGLFGAEIGHYFRNLYHILVYIEESSIENKERYFKLVQAQMCNNELYLLFYNSISSYGKEKMYPLVENNKLLENLRYPDYKYFELHQRLFYPETNFKR